MNRHQLDFLVTISWKSGDKLRRRGGPSVLRVYRPRRNDSEEAAGPEAVCCYLGLLKIRNELTQPSQVQIGVQRDPPTRSDSSSNVQRSCRLKRAASKCTCARMSVRSSLELAGITELARLASHTRVRGGHGSVTAAGQ